MNILIAYYAQFCPYYDTFNSILCNYLYLVKFGPTPTSDAR